MSNHKGPSPREHSGQNFEAGPKHEYILGQIDTQLYFIEQITQTVKKNANVMETKKGVTIIKCNI